VVDLEFRSISRPIAGGVQRSGADGFWRMVGACFSGDVLPRVDGSGAGAAKVQRFVRCGGGRRTDCSEHGIHAVAVWDGIGFLSVEPDVSGGAGVVFVAVAGGGADAAFGRHERKDDAVVCDGTDGNDDDVGFGSGGVQIRDTAGGDQPGADEYESNGDCGDRRGPADVGCGGGGGKAGACFTRVVKRVGG